MKKFITAAAILLVSGFAFGQDDLTVKMNVKVEGLPPEYASMAESEMVSYTKGDKSKEEQSSMMGSSIMLNDGKIVTMLMEQMGDKSGWTATKEELEASNKEKEEDKPKIEYLSDKKMIAGYECMKAIITNTGKDKVEHKITVWYTDKLKFTPHKGKPKGPQSMNFGDLKGRPLQIETEMKQQGMEMKVIVTASEVSTAKIDDSVFIVDLSGYRMSTYKEMLEKQNAKAGK